MLRVLRWLRARPLWSSFVIPALKCLCWASHAAAAHPRPYTATADWCGVALQALRNSE